ncbi:MAG: YdcF family protein [Candidatus Buchananbacteria bacterium]
MNILFIPVCEASPPENLAGTENLRRLKTGLRLYQSGGYEFILLSGGGGTIVEWPSTRLMQRYLVRNGVPSDKIIVEQCSVTTFENVEFSLQILREEFPGKEIWLTVVSQWQHTLRFWLTLRAYEVKFIICPQPSQVSGWQTLGEWAYLVYTWYDPTGRKYFAKWGAKRRRQKRR